MSRNWRIFLLAALVTAVIGGAGKYIGFAALAVLGPIYGLLLVSIFLLAFIVVAGVSVTIGRAVLDHHKTVKTQPAIIMAEEDERRPKAA